MFWKCESKTITNWKENHIVALRSSLLTDSKTRINEGNPRNYIVDFNVLPEFSDGDYEQVSHLFIAYFCEDDNLSNRFNEN